MILINLIKKLWGLAMGSKIFFKVIANYGLICETVKLLEDTLANMQREGRKVPNQQEMCDILPKLSELLKTGIIDLPMVDEYSLALDIDHIYSSMQISLRDRTGNKIVAATVIKKSEEKIEEPKE